MDFFESQNLARRNTRFLLLLFLLAVASLIILTNLLIFVLVNFQDSARVGLGQYYFSWEVFFTVTCSVVLLITLASLFRLLSLRKGGAAIAELMDAKLLVDAQGDLNKHKLLNVVEEMVNMIIAQRAYEINSKSIQTSDDMLSRVNQLKR